MMDQPKTFPIRTTNAWLDEVQKAADKNGNSSKHDFIVEAVNEKVKSVLKK